MREAVSSKQEAAPVQVIEVEGHEPTDAVGDEHE